MPLLRPCLYLLFLGDVATSAVADEPQLVVEVREAGTGKVLRGVACALVRAGAKRAYARFESPDYRGRVAVADGDTLLVYRRGCDMARVLLTEDLLQEGVLKRGQRSVEVALRPASRLCAIDLAETDKEDVRLRLSWWIEPIGEWIGKEPIVDFFHEDANGLPLKRKVPRGARVFVSVSSPGRLLWPRTSFLKGDRPEVVLREEEAWRPILRLDPPESDPEGPNPKGPNPKGPDESGPVSLAFLPDYSFVPPGPAVRTDAWKWHVTSAGWTRTSQPRDGQKLAVLPPVPILALASVGGRTVARRCRPGDDVVDLRLTEADRNLMFVPLVDRRPAPAGSFVLSGRHDVATVGALLASRGEFPAMVLSLVGKKRGELPENVELVASDWLTVWHPRFGLAHLRWPKGESRERAPEGRWYSGSMEIRAPGGWLIDGSVVAFPIWRGTGKVQATPPVEPLRRKFRNVATARWGGLRPGWHSFVMRLDLIEKGTNRRHSVKTTYTAEVTPERLRHAYRLHSPDGLPRK